MDGFHRIVAAFCLLASLSLDVQCLTVNAMVNNSVFYAQPGTTAKLVWQMTLDPSETFKEVTFFVQLDSIAKIVELDSSGNSILEKKDIPELYRDRVSGVKRDDHVSLMIKNVNENFEKKYYVKVQSSTDQVQTEPYFLRFTVGPPVINTVEPDDTSIKISWRSPKITGVNFQGKYAVKYHVVGKDKVFTEVVRQLSYTATNLEENAEYEFNIHALDEAGEGPPATRRVKTGADGALSATSIGIIIGVILLVIIVIAFIVMIMKAKKNKGKEDEKTVRMNGGPSPKPPEKEETYDDVEKEPPRNSYNSYPSRDEKYIDDEDTEDYLPPNYDSLSATLRKSQEYIGPTYALV